MNVNNRNTLAILLLFIANIATILLYTNKSENAGGSEDLVNPTIGEVTLFAGNYAPRGWALCHGQLLSINENITLFSILGTTYGGDGRTTFGLPDLRGRVVVGAGQGPGITNSQLGQKTGSEFVNITVQNLPAHNHSASGQILLGDGLATTELGNDSRLAVNTGTAPIFTDNPVNSTKTMVGSVEVTTGFTGNSQQLYIEQPSQSLNYIIALTGTFPSRP